MRNTLRNADRLMRKAFSQPSYAMRAAWKRTQATWARRRKTGRAFPPETVTLFLTWNCNLRCKMCGQWGENGSTLPYPADRLHQSLSTDAIHRLLRDLKPFRPTITFFGGEPLLRSDIAALVARAKQGGMRCNIITNGTALPARAHELVASGLDELIVSVDGPEEVHDGIRGAKGSFGKLMAGAERLRMEKARGRRRGPILHVSSTITEENWRHLDATIAAAEAMGAGMITFHHSIFLGPDVYEFHRQIFEPLFHERSEDWAGFVRSAAPRVGVDPLLESIRRLRGRNGGTAVAFYPNFSETEVRRYYAGAWFNPLAFGHRCSSPWLQCYVFPDGSVRPCESMNLSVGDIHRESFPEIWNGDRFLAFRNDLRERGEYPACNKCTEYYRF